MPRPEKMRRIWYQPHITEFKPAGVPWRMVEKNVLSLDQVEALRLADMERMSQEEAARQMGISRATFGRIIASARKKVADALINGKGITYSGGNYQVQAGWFYCRSCGFRWRGGYQPGMLTCRTCGDTGVERFGYGRRRHGQKKKINIFLW